MNLRYPYHDYLGTSWYISGIEHESYLNRNIIICGRFSLDAHMCDGAVMRLQVVLISRTSICALAYIEIDELPHIGQQIRIVLFIDLQ